MAFPIPDHLPRKQIPADVSSQILTKISDATSKSLTAGLAAQWVSELELNVQQTKDRIYERIHEKLPEFERQLELSRSVQTRLRELSSNVDRAAETLEDPQEGLLPALVNSLKAHKELSQRALDARITYEALTYLDKCRIQVDKLNDLVNEGRLTEGITNGNQLAELLDGAPEALERADVMADMKNQLRALRYRIEEQLNEAYSRSVRISSTELRLSPSVQVRQSQTIVTLRNILGCLSPTSLDSLLATLRRDIVAYFIDFPLQQACSSNVERITGDDGTPSIVFSIFPLPPSPALRSSTPTYLKSLFDFLRENLFVVLPSSTASSFPQSLYKPTTTALLRDVIVPSLPSSLTGLPAFLDLVRSANEFEEEYILKLASCTESKLRGESEIRAWARGVSGHYGRKRRIDLLAEARKVILSGTDGRTVRVELSEPPETNLVSHVPDVIPVQGEIGAGDEVENGWEFDDDEPTTSGAKTAANGKALDDESKAHFEQTEENGSGTCGFDDAGAGASDQTKVEEDAQDDSDAWEWGDDEENSTPATSENGNTGSSAKHTNGHQATETVTQENSEEAAWDSAWDGPDPAPASLPSQSPAKAPKVAKGLEKRTAKGKQKSATSSALPSNPPSSTIPTSISPAFQPFAAARASSPDSFSSPAPTSPKAPPPQIAQSGPSRPPALSLLRKPKMPETYLISAHVQDLVHLISEILSEGRATAASPILSDFPLAHRESNNKAGTLIFQAAPAAIDLYRAVYPVVFATELSRPARALRFANDCMYMHEEVAKLNALPPKAAVASSPSVHEQMREALERLHALGAWWFDEGVERECERVLHILSRAEGFTDTSNLDRFDECEAVMSEALREIRTATGEWKTILPRSKWLQAAGRLVETALRRVLDDILAIPDIPELDSQRLSELCRILNALEGLFVDMENPEAPSMVLDYVPSWLKYSYLSELLEATIADISYLFDEGALIDFTIDELVRLVRALFADTPLRSNTIAKLQRGHPVPTQ